VEEVLSELKSRNIIPGWPRGRSTSRPYPPLFVKDAGVYKIEWGIYSRFRDYCEDRAEERRKAEMMEAYWQIERDGFREMIVLNLSHLLIEESL
jgi:hypothetical protein